MKSTCALRKRKPNLEPTWVPTEALGSTLMRPRRDSNVGKKKRENEEGQKQTEGTPSAPGGERQRRTDTTRTRQGRRARGEPDRGGRSKEPSLGVKPCNPGPDWEAFKLPLLGTNRVNSKAPGLQSVTGHTKNQNWLFQVRCEGEKGGRTQRAGKRRVRSERSPLIARATQDLMPTTGEPGGLARLQN